jgi:hypothetical protein
VRLILLETTLFDMAPKTEIEATGLARNSVIYKPYPEINLGPSLHEFKAYDMPKLSFYHS